MLSVFQLKSKFYLQNVITPKAFHSHAEEGRVAAFEKTAITSFANRLNITIALE